MVYDSVKQANLCDLTLKNIYEDQEAKGPLDKENHGKHERKFEGFIRRCEQDNWKIRDAIVYDLAYNDRDMKDWEDYWEEKEYYDWVIPTVLVFAKIEARDSYEMRYNGIETFESEGTAEMWNQANGPASAHTNMVRDRVETAQRVLNIMWKWCRPGYKPEDKETFEKFIARRHNLYDFMQLHHDMYARHDSGIKVVLTRTPITPPKQ